ncbi:hypothetical protein FNU79_17760 [Deinococcus detaillensis]|uniref:Uncharacterized protein n=1 Tax=Deinococcus detaillensis TaxID=2592048 RepID=A0A553UH54_9DEIO|nr:hypothetical protein [Deinococcus detaillensis]TSA79537.1 hypothetical protein FNU79_17760 [Deinococcus detaillensis]
MSQHKILRFVVPIEIILVVGYILKNIYNSDTSLAKSSSWILIYALFHILYLIFTNFAIFFPDYGRKNIGKPVRRLPQTLKTLIPLYGVLTVLFTIDAVLNLKLASNPITLFLSFAVMPYIMSRSVNKRSFENVLRMANATNVPGIAVQGPQNVTDYSKAVRPK